MQVDKLIIPGRLQPFAAGATDEVPAQTFVIEASTRGLAESHPVDISHGELVELRFEDDTVWLCNGDTIGEAFPEAVPSVRSADPSFFLPTQVSASGTEQRGFLDTVALKVVRIFAGKAMEQVVAKGVRELAADLEEKQLEGHRGLFLLNDDFTFDKFGPAEMAAAAATAGQPYLLFLHGTASSTSGSFGGLTGSELWGYIRQTYGPNGVLAFQHETLTKSPLENTLELIEALPANSALHLISHSRGGLIGELLARFCNGDEANLGFDHNEKEYLAKTDRTADLELIRQISSVVVAKRLTVRKFVRVACPAGGTILASDRLERFFNISLNLLGYATGLVASPVYTAFKNLIGALLASPGNADVLPGLEAMNPESPFIKVLNSPATTVRLDSPLVVISGNCTIKPSLKALVVLVSKLFYLKNNDLVVNTTSMYQGARRTKDVQYYFDASPEIDHFHYFKNARTVKSLTQVLQAPDGALLPGFATINPFEGVLSDRNALLGLDSGNLFRNKVSGDKPIVVLLPGIMGSTLATGKKPLWINYLRFVMGDLADLAIDSAGISTIGVVRSSYERLADYLAPTYDVVTFPFDWRLSLLESAKLLNDKLTELLRFKQPIKLIAHSMGGLLVRDFILQHPATWQELNHSSGFQLVMLGCPLRGSFRIPAVLMGLDGIINKLGKIDIRHTKEDLIRIFAQFPGILNLLPIADAEGTGNDFALKSTWQTMLAAVGGPADMLPTDELLVQFGEYQKLIKDVNKGLDKIDYRNAVYIAGQDEATPNGYRISAANGRPALEFTYTGEGDSSVTWATGIPKQLPAQAVYFVKVTHGALADAPGIFAGISEILAKGSTTALSHARPATRGVMPVARLTRAEDFDLSAAGVAATLLGLPTAEPASVATAPLRVRVANGDLRYANFPLLAGHFSKDGIHYAERAIDAYLDQALSQRRSLGSYPGPIGSNELFLPAGADYRGAIIVGLGEFGQLTAFGLTTTVEQGASKYLHGLASGNLPGVRPRVIGLSALIIGSGYGGLTVETSVRAVLQGVQNANVKLRKLLGEQAPAVSTVEFVELYEDMAVSCIYAVQKIEREASASLPAETEYQRIQQLFGAKKRLPIDQTSNWWNQLNVELPQEEKETKPGAVRRLQFTLSTGGAHEERRELRSNKALIEQFLQDISLKNDWSAESAKIVFELLIPNDLKESLQRQSNLSWVLDKEAAAYPWELLQDTVNDNKPLCVNAGMIRRLATPDYRPRIVRAVQETALVVGDPLLEGFLPQLDGAAKEALAVESLLNTNLTTTRNVGGTATSIVRDLFRQDYKVVHLAGHGLFQPDQPESSGMVIGKDLFLSTQEIDQMSAVPELVFVNCCYLGQTDGSAERQSRDRYKLAANIGTQLIEIGVKAVVVAGWAVDDAAALIFAQTFYSQLVNGCPFGEAVLAARRTVYEQTGNRSNTWGAYQCYGDPFYKLRNVAPVGRAQERSYVIAEEAEIELLNLYNELESGRYVAEQVIDELAAIGRGVDKCQLRTPTITEHEAYIYQELYDLPKAFAKLEKLLQAERATYSVAALEKSCNIRAKLCVQGFAKGTLDAKAARQEMDDVIEELQALLRLGRTNERLNLLGSTHKRLAMLIANDQPELLETLRTAAGYYQKATEGCENRYQIYALTNWYTLEALCGLLGQKWDSKNQKGLPPLKKARQQLTDAISAAMADGVPADMDYWTMMEAANCKLCLLLLAGTVTAAETAELLQLYRRTWDKAGSLGKKKAEVEQLAFLRHAFRQATPTPDKANLGAFLDSLYAEFSQQIAALENGALAS
ncbi:CHAT domain-containing protein [Hymenobacter convexus]|uniref:CHAT domain-containing protein n=1 Tax=Hymenobacter sp. CA1UV-4 TaxID=3063782 RepID=UPI00271256DF|nr:CHAT domain-containing protein [Hymenobacter sp. CA1UV-4]MDO7853534.1 CHAT domain-containing protein [Hymenobacter sp. CA1UV-4]